MTAGAWFKVDQAYVEIIDRFMTSVSDVTDDIALPAWDDQWLKANINGQYPEDRYNKFVSDRRRFGLLDYQFYRGAPGSGQQVEICDLPTPEKQLVCVKRLDGGKSMVHLFAQGALSASMMRDEEYRKRLLRDLEACGGGSDFGAESDWLFVYAISTHRQGNLHELLPFFARAALYNSAEVVRGRGFEIALAKIDHVA